MTKKLTKDTGKELYYLKKSEKIIGAHNNLSNCKWIFGDCSELFGECNALFGDCSGLFGDCSNLSGDCSGISGNCIGIYGDCTDICGNLDDCNVTDEERKKGVNIYDLVKEDINDKKTI